MGRRTWEHNQDSTRETTYDALGRLSTVTDIDTGRSLEYQYDASGNRTRLTILPDNQVTTYAHDARGQLIRLTDPEGGEYRFARDALGRRTVTSYPNGIARHTVYDAASQILGLVYVDGDGALLDLFGYTYDTSGNRTAKLLLNGSAEQYGYDALNRLTSATYPSGRVVRYTHDAVGNRLSMTEGASGAGTGTGSIPEPCPGDRDCDAVPDIMDNCPYIANPDQQDSDSDTTALNFSGARGVWLFEQSEGSTALDSVGSNHGTLVNDPTRIAGRFGRALGFDGVNDRVGSSSSAQARVTRSFTMELWAYPEAEHPITPESTSGRVGDMRHAVFATQGKQAYGSGHAGAGLSVGTNGISVLEHASFYLPTVLVWEHPVEGWTHIAAVYDDGTPSLYVNGSQVKTGLRSGRIVHPSAHLGGDYRGNNYGFYQGKLDDFAVYDRALDPSTIYRHARQGLYGDGLGDACDPCPYEGDPSCVPLTCQDGDGDGYGVQGASSCPASPTSADFDCTGMWRYRSSVKIAFMVAISLGAS